MQLQFIITSEGINIIGFQQVHILNYHKNFTIANTHAILMGMKFQSDTEKDRGLYFQLPTFYLKGNVNNNNSHSPTSN